MFMMSCVVGEPGVKLDSVIADVKSTYDEIVDDPYDSFCYSPASILVLGLEAANFYQNQNGDGKSVADILEPRQKDKLISSAVEAGLFSSYSDSKGWFIGFGGVDYNLCSKIKQSCGLSGSYDEITIIEFLNYLGLVNPEDIDNIDNYRRIRNNMYLDMSSLLSGDQDDFRQLSNFLKSEIPINFLDDQIDYFTEDFINQYKDRISEEGLKSEIIDEITVFEKRFGELDTVQKDELCKDVSLYLLGMVNNDELSSFITDLDAIRKYSGVMPEGSKDFLKKYFNKQLLKETLESEEIKNMRKAYELYMSDVSDIDGIGQSFVDLLSVSDYSGTYIRDMKERMISQAVSLMQKVDNKSPGSKILKDYIQLYELFFDEENERTWKSVQYSVRQTVFDSVSETEDLFGSDYVFTWDDVIAKMKAFAGVYPDSGGASEELLAEFKYLVRERALDEAEHLKVDCLGFLRDVLKDKELTASFESKFEEWYGMKYRSYEDIGESGLLKTARRYNEVFGEYPYDFYGEFQNTLVGDLKLCVDAYEDGGFHQNMELDANIRSLKWLLMALKEGEFEILPDVKDTIKEIKNNQPMLYQILPIFNYDDDE
ncbi:MAG: hypothetical protein KAR23_02710 [Candidatus Aenigmarchaeota archaeon]|nr:hypothetical protein [Candidatus Aenigmarchaeota archaeon]